MARRAEGNGDAWPRWRGSRRPALPQLRLGAAADGDIRLALGVVAILVVLILPLPAFLLDVLLALSITIAVLILMTALFIKKPLEFTAFPTVLLVATLLRLALNIASTRLILGHGHEGARPPATSSRPSAASMMRRQLRHRR